MGIYKYKIIEIMFFVLKKKGENMMRDLMTVKNVFSLKSKCIILES